MNNNLVISEMTMEDFFSIKDVLILEFDDFWSEEILKGELESPNSYYLVAKSNNEVVAFAGIKAILDEADIMNIVTRKNARNLGIGTLLFEKLILISIDKGIKKLTLEVNEKNLPAIHLYEKFGFKKIAIRKKYYNNADSAIIMQLTIAENKQES